VSLDLPDDPLAVAIAGTRLTYAVPNKRTVVDVEAGSFISSLIRETILDTTVHAVALSADGLSCVTADEHSTQVWRDGTGVVAEFPSEPGPVAVSAAGRIVAARTAAGTVVIRESRSERLLSTRRPAYANAEITALALAPDGTLLATGDALGVIRVWAVADPARSVRTFGSSALRIIDLAFSPDGRRLASIGDDHSVTTWEVEPWTGSRAGLPPMRLTVLPAGLGTSLVLELGAGDRPFRIVVDGGPSGAYEGGLRAWAAALPSGDREIDVLAVTHSAAGAVDGVIRLLEDRERLGLTIGDLWYNGWPDAVG
jgi:hypothetical protein